MAYKADESDPVVVLIEDAHPPSMTFNEWLDLVGRNEPAEIGLSAVDLLAEAREHGEI